MQRTKTDVIEQWARIASAIFIPIILACGGWKIQRTIAEQSTSKDYVHIAVGILAAQGDDDPVDDVLRNWAVDLLVLYAPIPLDEDAEAQLRSGEIVLPSSAAPFPDDLLDRWSSGLSTDKRRLAAELTVRSYYDSINSGQYTKAWASLTDDFKRSIDNESLADYVEFYSTTIERIDIIELASINYTNTTSTFLVRLQQVNSTGHMQGMILEITLTLQSNEEWKISNIIWLDRPE